MSNNRVCELVRWRDSRAPFVGTSPEGECAAYSACSVKEVIQPQVPLRLPCYDFAPVTALAFGGSAWSEPVPAPTSGARSSHGVTGGVYKARERIHRGVADPRLLAIPASRRRVAARSEERRVGKECRSRWSPYH